jgi:hypothetical protein
MRTTLDIDDDILSAAKDLARADKKTVGQVISDLARKALTAPELAGMAEEGQSNLADWPTLPRRGGIVTTELVRRIQDEIDAEEGIPWDFTTGKPRQLDDSPSRPEGGRRLRRRKPAS